MFTAITLNPIEFSLFTFPETVSPAAVEITGFIIVTYPVSFED